MNLSVLKTDKEKLLNYMREQHFSENYVARHNQMSDFIVKHMVENTWCSFADIYNWVKYQPYTKRYAKDFLKILRNLESFHSKGFFPGNGHIQAALKEIVPSSGQLDLVFLQKHLEELLAFMRANDYGEDYIRLIHFIANRIIFLSRTISWDSYFDIWQWYQSQDLKPSYLQNVLAALGILEAFHLRNEMPNNRETQNLLCLKDNSYNHLNNEYSSLVNYAIDQYNKRLLSDSTVVSIKSVVSSFLLYLQEAGVDTLHHVDSSIINAYFQTEAVRVNGRGVYARLRNFFNLCIPYNEECRRIALHIPIAPSGRKNIQYITEEEGCAFCAALSDLDNKLTYKTRAICTTLYYTGLRSSDIANLKLDSIDLKAQTIQIIQQKTGVPLTIPLPLVVGNAIYDYCTLERPISDSEYLFLGRQAPHHKIGSSAIYAAVSSAMDTAGIRQCPGDRRGTHIFRHRAATTMMENNISPAIISQTLGHASPKSLNTYLYADKVHLKECALSLAAFPIGMEVFASV